MTDANFAEICAKGVVLVDLWSERCPPCRMQGPIIDRVARRFAGSVTVGKLDVDVNRRTSFALGLMYIPTLVIYRDGKEAQRFVGLQQEEALAAALEQVLARE